MAEYLAKCYGVTLNRFYRMNLISLALTYGILICWATLVQKFNIFNTLNIEEQIYMNQVYLGIAIGLPTLLLLLSWHIGNRILEIRSLLQQ